MSLQLDGSSARPPASERRSDGAIMEPAICESYLQPTSVSLLTERCQLFQRVLHRSVCLVICPHFTLLVGLCICSTRAPTGMERQHGCILLIGFSSLLRCTPPEFVNKPSTHCVAHRVAHTQTVSFEWMRERVANLARSYLRMVA